MLLCERLYRLVLFVLNLLYLSLPFPLHLLSKQEHLVLVLKLYFVGYAFILRSDSSCLFILVFSKGIQILLVSDLLLLLLNFQCTEILFELSLVDTVFIFHVL